MELSTYKWKEEDITRMKGNIADSLEVDVEKLIPSARIKEDLGADSLDLYEIYYMLDAEFGINEPEDKMTALKTVQDFMDLIEYRVEVNRCSWKGDGFSPCGYLWKGLREVMEVTDKGVIVESDFRPLYYAFCPFCGADIRKPKPPEPIIKKSGETWVARFEGVDYLMTDPWKCEPPFNKHYVKEGSTAWKPFSEIEITDEIAKLRPMVVASIKDMEGIIVRLFGMCRCSTDLAICERADAKTTDLFYDASVRLATVEDL